MCVCVCVVCVCVCVCVNMGMSEHICDFRPQNMYLCMCVCIYFCTYLCVYIFTYLFHVYIYMGRCWVEGRGGHRGGKVESVCLQLLIGVPLTSTGQWFSQDRYGQTCSEARLGMSPACLPYLHRQVVQSGALCMEICCLAVAVASGTFLCLTQ